MSNDNKQTDKPQLTRIPLDAVWFRSSEEQDFPGSGNSMMPMVNFGVSEMKGRQYFLGYFVPSYQVVYIEWYRNGEAEPERFPVPLAVVKKMKETVRKAA